MLQIRGASDAWCNTRIGEQALLKCKVQGKKGSSITECSDVPEIAGRNVEGTLERVSRTTVAGTQITAPRERLRFAGFSIRYPHVVNLVFGPCAFVGEIDGCEPLANNAAQRNDVLRNRAVAELNIKGNDRQCDHLIGDSKGS